MFQLFKYLIPDVGVFANSIFPVLIYRDAFELKQMPTPKQMEELFAENDWKNSWRNGIYHQHHYHSVVHEVLGIYEGSCDVKLGGEKGIRFTLKPYDVVIIPAGVAHKNEVSTHDFKCIGAYPEGKDFDMNFGKPGDRPKTDENIAKVKLPEADPVFGVIGQLFRYWK